jgi:hypothetical protein
MESPRRNLRIVGPDEPPPPPDTAWPPFLAEWVLPYLREPALMPVLLALLGHVVVVLAPLMLAVWRVHSVEAALLLLLVAGGSVFPLRWECLDEGRPGGVSATVVLTWLASVAAAYFGDRTGVL